MLSITMRSSWDYSNLIFMIDWGWFAVITKPLFTLLDWLNNQVRQFWRGDLDHYGFG